MPLWYLVRAGELWAWTYAKSQKVRNLERDPRATLQVEDGVEYDQLRGVMIEATTVIHRETEQVAEFGLALFARYAGGGAGGGAGGAGAGGGDSRLAAEAVRAQAAKRVALQFVPRRVTSWDHRKLGGVY
jgi:Pyridoxamine 5'-phosphate oxidase